MGLPLGTLKPLYMQPPSEGRELMRGVRSTHSVLEAMGISGARHAKGRMRSCRLAFDLRAIPHAIVYWLSSTITFSKWIFPERCASILRKLLATLRYAAPQYALVNVDREGLRVHASACAMRSKGVALATLGMPFPDLAIARTISSLLSKGRLSLFSRSWYPWRTHATAHSPPRSLRPGLSSLHDLARLAERTTPRCKARSSYSSRLAAHMSAGAGKLSNSLSAVHWSHQTRAPFAFESAETPLLRRILIATRCRAASGKRESPSLLHKDCCHRAGSMLTMSEASLSRFSDSTVSVGMKASAGEPSPAMTRCCTAAASRARSSDAERAWAWAGDLGGELRAMGIACCGMGQGLLMVDRLMIEGGLMVDWT